MTQSSQLYTRTSCVLIATCAIRSSFVTESLPNFHHQARTSKINKSNNYTEAGAGDTHDTHDTHSLQGALFFRVPQQNLSIQVPKTCYARSDGLHLSKKLCRKNSELVMPMRYARSLPMRYARSSHSLPSKTVLHVSFYGSTYYSN